MGVTWPVGLSTGMFLRQPLLSALEPIQRAGFSRIEVASFRSHFDYHDLAQAAAARKEMDRLGLRACSLHAPYSERIDLTLLDEDARLQAVAEMQAAIDALVVLGADTLVLHAGTATESEKDQTEQRLWQSVKSLLQVRGYCLQRGVTLAVEDMLPHLVGGRSAEMWWLLSQIPQEGVGVCLDTGHSFLSGSLWDRVKLFGPRLRMMHAHDNRRTFDDHLPPGEGLIDWPRLLDQLLEAGFRGEIVLEINETDDTQSALERAKRGVALLQQYSVGKGYAISL